MDRGYDCHHLVVVGESPAADHGWLIAGGSLQRYFGSCGGLEIQIRTVAAHAWAEFEHARRYKGVEYHEISRRDREAIDQLFRAASDARTSLDEIFVAIEHLIARPSSATSTEPAGEHAPTPADDEADDHIATETATPVGAQSLRDFLAARFPDDETASEKGIEFACKLVQACGLSSIEELAHALEAIDSEQVRRLMDTSTSVTTVRRLDDELLARFGEGYITATGEVGTVRSRTRQLDWRYDRLRGKATVAGYKIYELVGTDCPSELRGTPAARAVREVARVVAARLGVRAALVTNSIAEAADELQPSANPREVPLATGGSLWVATNLNREASESLLRQLLEPAEGIDLRVIANGREVASTA